MSIKPASDQFNVENRVVFLAGKLVNSDNFYIISEARNAHVTLIEK